MDSVLGHEQQYDDLCEALRSKIKRFKRENPNLSGLQIAKIFGMASSTLNRIENRSIRTPSIDQVVKVLRGVGAHDELIGFMDEYYPAISDTFRNHHIECQRNNVEDRSLINLVLDQSYFKIFMLGICGQGVSSELISRMFGLEGLAKADELVSKTIFSYDGVIYKQAENCTISFDCFSSKELMLKTVENFYRPKANSNIDKAMLSVDTFSFENPNFAKEVVSILKDARNKIIALADNQNNKGDCKYFVTMCCDTIS